MGLFSGAKVFASTFGKQLGTAAIHEKWVASGANLQGRMANAFRGIRNDAMNTAFKDPQGLRNAFSTGANWSEKFMNGAEFMNKGGMYGAYNNSFVRNAAIGSGVGSALGAAKSYRDGDGFGGYVKNMALGGAAGVWAGHGYSMMSREGTYLNRAGQRVNSAMRTAWSEARK